MNERKYQAMLIRRIRLEFPECIILKNDPDYLQGILDLTILFWDKWAMLEVKASKDSPLRPNQQFYVDWLHHMSFAAVIYPENEEEVFRGLQETFRSARRARLPRTQEPLLGEL